MRIYRYATDKSARIAIAVDDGPLIDLDAALGSSAAEVGSTLAFIQAGPDAWTAAAAAVRAASDDAVVPDDAKFLNPLDRIESLRDFLAFEDHVKGGAERRGTTVPDYWYEAPVYYKGNHRTLIGPNDECPWPSYTSKMDFELELGMIVGTGGRDIDAGSAGRHIFGFTVFNDLSARDIQSKEMSAWLGPAKGKDFANAFGPCIVTADELGAEPDLEMICRVNGHEWGRARSSAMRWNWGDMIAHVSRDEDIFPGDVYGSGTPGGCCGLDIGRSLTPGDVVELEIEQIGVLRNSIGDRR